ncbi:MAG: DUF1830 domain-containing protein [Symploca sp. SIO3C6]|uniref:DUF1830 domain-containing protein n=1 Tax=Symploca sp. SIO1C4 TaxID=2607765 RepID=A0A6B3NEA3_9CYAN|nr:DUF1830 domain-containing protein [Symploca sp. SIO3C6]NER27971.1 DUF1830 domain-containing protein [Symploca sp. SIO1C4]NET03444.1 DUF1830 domain-containing protein [Symploca sp. SIO2B6]NET50437.1 DUF1830 domain-containing protein [Merismopedia sp. SIO2A8]
MTHIFNRLPSEYTDRLFCCYANKDRELLVARITNIPGWRLERVVFPGERFLFEAPSSAILEIHRNSPNGPTCSESLPCAYLNVAGFGKSSGAAAVSSVNVSSIPHRAVPPQTTLKI